MQVLQGNTRLEFITQQILVETFLLPSYLFLFLLYLKIMGIYKHKRNVCNLSKILMITYLCTYLSFTVAFPPQLASHKSISLPSNAAMSRVLTKLSSKLIYWSGPPPGKEGIRQTFKIVYYKIYIQYRHLRFNVKNIHLKDEMSFNSSMQCFNS